MQRERVSKSKSRTRSSDIGDAKLAPEASSATRKSEALKGDLDSVLDDIDSVLEKNAEEFVNAYVQKGGE